MTYDYRGARDRIFGITRDEKGKVKEIIPTPATLSERALLLALVEFAPNIEPSTDKLAKMLGTDARSIRRWIRSCETKRLLAVTQRHLQTSHYELLWDPKLTIPPDVQSSPDTVSPRTDSPVPPDAQSGPPRTSSPPKQTSKADKKAGKVARSASHAQEPLKLVPEEPKEISDFTAIRDLYFKRFESVRGMKPPFDGRDGKAIKALLAKCSASQAAEAVEGAFRGWRSDSVTIVEIAKQPAAFIGMREAGNRGHGGPKQPNSGNYRPPMD